MEDTRAPYDPMPHGPPEVGVGPWEGTRPEGEQYDAELLRDGDRRNVVDRYRYWTVEAIRADLDTRRHDFHVAIENWQHDFNIGTIVRTANAFLAAEVHIVGNRRWNRRGAMVTDRYQHLRHHATPAGLAAYLHEPDVGQRVEPNCAIESVPSHASRAASESPGPSWPNRKQTRRGSLIVSRCWEPGRLSMPSSSTPTSASWRYAARSAGVAWWRRCW